MYQIKANRLEGDNVLFRKSPNFRRGFWPTGLVYHDTASSLNPGTAVDWLCDPDASASAHLVFERSDLIYQLVDFNRRAWHAGISSYRDKDDCNQFTFGLEVDNPGKLTPNDDGNGVTYFGKVFDRKEYNLQFMDTQEHGPGLWMPYTEG